MDEARLIEKLRAIEALHARPGTDGEREAAANARERILARLREVEASDPPVEFRFSMPDLWSRRVFIALLRRYGLTPYRFRGQRHTTVMVRVPKGFVDETLWPEYLELSKSLRAYLDEVTNRVVAEVIHADASEAEEVDAPRPLELGASTEATAPAAGVEKPPSAGASGQQPRRNKTKKKRRRSR